MAQTAAELIARIAVQGMNQYASDISRAQSMFDALGNTVRNVFRDMEMASVAGIGAFTAFTTAAVAEATKVERLTLSFAALGHSMAFGRAELTFLREYATHSINTFDNLTAAALRLQTAGLNPNRFIRMLDVMGGIMGPGAQGLNQIADAFARISSGSNMGMAMRSLTRVGIGYNDLRQEGVNVSGRNQIKATPEEVLSALERIFQRKFGEMGDYLQSSMTTRFANLQDAWLRLLDSFGKAWFPLITNILDALTPFINFLSASGEIEKISAAFANLFGGMKDGGWIRILMFGVAILEDLPNIIQTTWDYVKGFMTGFGNLLIGFIDLIVEGIGRMVTLLHDLSPFIEGLGNVARGIAAATGHGGGREVFANGLPGIGGFGGSSGSRFAGAVAEAGNREFAAAGPGGARTAIEVVLGQLPRIGNIFENASKRTDQLMADFNKYLNTPGVSPADPNGGSMFTANHAIESATQDTARNTGQMAAHMDTFKKFVVGGGERGKYGISSSEFYGRGGIGSRSVRMDSGPARDMLERAVQEIMGETMVSWERHKYATH